MADNYSLWHIVWRKPHCRRSVFVKILPKRDGHYYYFDSTIWHYYVVKPVRLTLVH